MQCLHTVLKAIGNFLAPDQEAISNICEHSLAFFRISALPSIKTNHILKQTVIFLQGGPSISDHWHSWRCLLPVQCGEERAPRAIRHRLHEELRYVEPKPHLCCFVFMKPCCFLHKFHYPWDIFLRLFVCLFFSQEQKLHLRTKCSLWPEYLLLPITTNSLLPRFFCDVSKIITINLHLLINFLRGVLAGSTDTYTGCSLFQLFCKLYLEIYLHHLLYFLSPFFFSPMEAKY